MPPRSPGRTKRLDDAEMALEAFFNANKEHPRRGEARLGWAICSCPAPKRLKAMRMAKLMCPMRSSITAKRREVFASTQAELKAALEPLQGARVNADDEAGKALREKLRLIIDAPNS